MATKAQLMANGLPAAAASHLGQDAVTTLAATGTTQGGAAQMLGNFVVVSTCPSSAGILLKAARGQAQTVVYNGGANTLKIYPATGENINNGAANASVSVATTKTMILIGAESSWIGILGA